MSSYQIDFEPIGRRANLPPGGTVLDAAQLAGVGLLATCGGQGSCYDCRVRVVQGKLGPPTFEERQALSRSELAAGYRLACQALPSSDLKLDIPPESLSTPQRLSIEGEALPYSDSGAGIQPLITICDLRMEPPSLADLRDDASRLLDAARTAQTALSAPPTLHLSRRLLADLSPKLRAFNWQVRLALRNAEVIALLAPGSKLLGLAVDIGTTKLAAYLVDLETGATLARMGAMNPQIAYGEDVISRIHYANHQTEGRLILQTQLVTAVNQLAAALCAEIKQDPATIVEAVVVGNTVMHHLFAGLPVEQLGASPYVPTVAAPLEFHASEIGLRLAPAAWVYMPANIAGYVGADHVAMLLATGMHKPQGCVLALDIGTNTEISLWSDGELRSCSCASGPAFEGAHIRDGMRAAPGAIEKISIRPGEPDHPFDVHVATINNQPAVGLCGSGILDAVAQLHQAGALDKRGGLKPGHPLVRSTISGTPRSRSDVLLVPASQTGHGRELTIERADINEIQLAKGAIAAGIDVLLAEAGMTLTQIDQVIVAGAFGTYLDLSSAIHIGMLPDIPLERFTQVGNAAGAGARLLLVSSYMRSAGLELARRAHYIELTLHPAFMPGFIRGMMLP